MKSQTCYLCNSTRGHLLWKKNNFNIVQCDLCGFIYVTPLPSRVSLDKFYKTFDYKNVIEAEKVIRKDAEQSLKKIEKFQQRRTLLDLGCGRGLPLIKRLKYLLFDRVVCGLLYRILNFDHWGTKLEIIGAK
ncbi:hypothetical protein HYV22_00425 [Candidatus Gottesmanbacteria bacterium]|nr:hypothetical protein [Candidatus Gottesmanbacteria bacterium]